MHVQPVDVFDAKPNHKRLGASLCDDHETSLLNIFSNSMHLISRNYGSFIIRQLSGETFKEKETQHNWKFDTYLSKRKREINFICILKSRLTVLFLDY